MKIFINLTETEIEPTQSLLDVIESRDFPAHGIAVAVNNRVVPRDKWNETHLNEGDKLTVITAVCGG